MKKLLLLIFAALTFPQEIDANALLDSLISIMNPENSQGVMTQTIVTTSGDTRTLEYDVYSGNKGEFSLMRYRKPSRVRGNAILMTDYSDNIWSYNHRTKRVRKLASHARKQKFEGSDFTYEDMGSGNIWKEDYSPKLTGSGKIQNTECISLELSAKSEEVSYFKIVCWVRKSDYFPLQIDYYDKTRRVSKSLHLEDISVIEGIPTAKKMTMKNLIDKTQTMMAYVEVTYDVTFGKDFFTERNLKKH